VWQFIKNFCVKEVTPFGINYNKSKNLDKLGAIAREKFMIRRSKEETLGQLPRLVRQYVPIKVTRSDDDSPLFKILSTIERDGNLLPFASERRELGLRKLDGVCEYIDELLQSEDRAVVFAHHSEVIGRLAHYFEANKISYVTITGSSSSKERQEAIDDFQDGKAQVFLGSMLACNTGITLTRAHNVVFAEWDWVPENNAQAEGRCYRIGQTEITRAHYLYAEDTIDEAILRAVLKKQKNVNKVMGN
jgi:SWI/SNF-related matrix-associated actin-dependent regulator 1 of chromatin subfamily A